MYACMHPFMSEKYKIREFLKSSFGILIKWYDYSIQGRIQIVKLLNPPCPLDADPMIQIKVSIVCTEILVCT